MFAQHSQPCGVTLKAGPVQKEEIDFCDPCGPLPTQDILFILASVFPYPINFFCSSPVTILDFQSLHCYLSDLPCYNVVIHLLKTHPTSRFIDVTLAANTLGFLHKVGRILNAQIMGDKGYSGKNQEDEMSPQIKHKPQITFQLFLPLRCPSL